VDAQGVRASGDGNRGAELGEGGVEMCFPRAPGVMLEPEVNQRFNLALRGTEGPFSIAGQEEFMWETCELELFACEVQIFG
jgi:hypothetical protein